MTRIASPPPATSPQCPAPGDPNPTPDPHRDPHPDHTPDTLPIAAWPVVVAERTRVAALREAYPLGDGPGAIVTQAASTFFPGAPAWAVAARDIPLAVDPRVPDSRDPTLTAVEDRPFVALPDIVGPFLGAVYAEGPDTPPGESGTIPRRYPDAPAVWPRAPVPVWFLAIIRTIGNVPVRVREGVAGPEYRGLSAWPTTLACALTGVLCRITAEEWAALDMARSLAPMATEGTAVPAAATINSLAPWTVYVATAPVAQAIVARHLPAWLATQTHTRDRGDRSPGGEDYGLGPAEVMQRLREVFIHHKAGWREDGGVCPQVIVDDARDTDIALAGSTYRGDAIDRVQSRLVLRGWSFPATNGKQHQPWPMSSAWTAPPDTSSIAHTAFVHGVQGAHLAHGLASDAWWCLVVWFRASRVLQTNAVRFHHSISGIVRVV